MLSAKIVELNIEFEVIKLATIYLISQGDAKSSDVYDLSASFNYSLSNLGGLHANMLANSLRDTRFEMVYSCTSPLSIETAGILNQGRKKSISVIKKLALEDFKADFDVNGECFDLPLCIHTMMLQPRGFCSSIYTQLKIVEKRLFEIIESIGMLYSGNVLIVLESLMVKLLTNYFLTEQNSETLWNTIRPVSLSILHSDAKGRHLILNNDISHYQCQSVA